MVRELSEYKCALLAILIAAVMAVPVTWAADVGGSQEVRPSESLLRIGLLGRLTNVNPFLALNDSSRMFASLVYDGLVSMDNDLEPVANLATTWRALATTKLPGGEPYGSVWEYKITHNATWHDGTPLTADDVVFTINLQVGTNFWWFWPGEAYTYFINYAEKVDKYTVRIHFMSPNREPMAVAFGGSMSMPIVPKHMLEALAPNYTSMQWSGAFTGAVPVVGSGPFMATPNLLDELSHGDHVTLIRNPYYHRIADEQKRILLDKIELHFYNNATTMSLALQRNQIDVAKFPVKEFKDLKAGISSGSITDISTFSGPSPKRDLAYISINCNPSFGTSFRRDLAVKRALAMSIDKDSIVRDNYSGYADVGSTLISPVAGDWHYEPTAAEKIGYSLAQANATLDAAGYRDLNGDGYREEVDGNPPYSLSLLVNSGSAVDSDIAKYIRSQLRKIGIATNLVVEPEPLFTLDLYSYRYDLAIANRDSEIDPNYLLYSQSNYSLAGWSDNSYNNASYNQDYLESVKELDASNRREHVMNCQRTQYLDVGYITFAYPYQLYAWRTDGPFVFGNWDTQPGRSLDAHWGGNAFLYDLLPSSWGDGTSVVVPDMYLSITVPDGWDYQRNVTVGGAFYDLAMNTTALGGYRAVAYLQVVNWTGEVTKRTLYDQAAKVIADLEQNYTLGFAVISPPENLTIDGFKAIQFTLGLNAGSTNVTERVVIVASEQLGLAWIMYLAAPESIFASASADLDVIQAGMSPEHSESNFPIWLAIIGVLIAAAAVSVIIVLLLRGKRGKASPEFSQLGPPSP